jgi:hypothetical protein
VPEIIGSTYAVGPSTPYVSPTMLLNWPTGISWSTIPGFNADQDQQYAVAAQLASSASAAVDEYLQVAPRATINTEVLYGPGLDERFVVMPSGLVRALLSCPPVLYAVSGTVLPAYSIGSGTAVTTIPVAQIVPERPIRGVYGTNAPSSVGEVGQAVLIAGMAGMWWNGRGGMQLTVEYANGWPHCSLISGATSGSNQLVVDDITAWVNPSNVGALGTIYDADASLQETVTAASVTPMTAGAISGPGTITLTTNLSNSHSEGTIFSALPGTIVAATIHFAVMFALMRGATATVMPTLQGAGMGGVKSQSTDGARGMAEALLHGYRRAR